MKTFCCLFLLVCIIITVPVSGQLIDQEPEEHCKQLSNARKEPISEWIKRLENPNWHSCALDAVWALGPEAAAAVPVLSKVIYVAEWANKKKATEALVRIADGNPESSAAMVFIEILAKKEKGSEMNQYAHYGLTKILKNWNLIGSTPLPGWPNVFPSSCSTAYHTCHYPIVSSDGRTYSQTIVQEDQGGESSTFGRVTLARDPTFAIKYAERVVLKDKNPPEIRTVSGRKVLFWDLNKGKTELSPSQPRGLNTRTVVLLASDKAWIREVSITSSFSFSQSPPELKFSDAEIAFLTRPKRLSINHRERTFGAARNYSSR